MTHTDLTHRIQDIITGITKKELIAPIHIRSLQPQGYEVCIEFRQY